MSKITSRWMGRAAASLGLVLAFHARAWAEWEVNMPRGTGALSAEIYDLHMMAFGVCVAIAVVVFGAMIWSIYHHRKSRGSQALNFSHSTRVEIVWTVIPIAILVAMAVPAAGTLVKMEDTRDSDLTVKVTGYQWKWHYDYLDEGINYFSNLDAESNRARQLGSGIDPASVPNYLLEVDRPLVVPVGAKVRLLLTSNDVIHSWWVPALGGKKDAIPGFVNEFWFEADDPGIYRGQCAELCGRDHAYMPVVVRVVPEAEFSQWLAQNSAGEPAAPQAGAGGNDEPVAPQAAESGAEAKWTLGQAMAEGESLYVSNCSACHQVNGRGLAAAGFPPLAGSPVATGPAPEHIRIAVHGRPGTAMTAFGPQLTDEQLAAIVTYQRNAWGNGTGDLIDPADVAAER